MTTRRWITRTSVVLALVASGCGERGEGSHAEEAAGEPVVGVRVRALEVRRFEDVLSASGQWRSSGDLVISAPFAGVIETLTVRIGDGVRPGERVGTLVTRESGAALKGAEMMIREARDATGSDEAAKALALARRDLVRVPLLAPQGGVVVRRSLEPGAQVAEGGEIVALAPAKALVFEAHVAADQMSRVRPGEAATVLEPGGTVRPAVVQRVLPMASSTDQAALVWLAPRASAPPPALDRFGTATIVVGAAHRATAVPDSALVEDDLTGERRVAVVDSAGRLSWTTVVVGGTDGAWRELKQPALATRTRVVIAGQRGLPDGTHVKPLP